MGWVYFASTPPTPIDGFDGPRVSEDPPSGADGWPIKIGISGWVSRRLLSLSHAIRRPMFFLGAMPGGPADERRVHEMFGHLRIPRAPFASDGTITEWFEPAWELHTFIASLPTIALASLDNFGSGGRASIGSRVAERRLHLGLSARSLDKKAGMTQGHTTLIESGQRRRLSARTAGKLAGALGVSMAWLIDGSAGDTPHDS